MEQPSGDVTTFSYDGASNLLSEVRTGASPYSGVYTYDRSNRRTSAHVVTNGVVVHSGVYSYDGAGRLAQVVDSATSPATIENYVWNADGTLAVIPARQEAAILVPCSTMKSNTSSASHTIMATGMW